jgi:hypothetical protein
MLGNRVFRVFVSSTFRDLAAERDALQERVFPQLRAHCAVKGYAFQAIDLRWGIREEAAAGHRTMRICLAEVARCQAVSPRPNFVVLLGDRYGWRPLPEIVAAPEFETVASLLSPTDRIAAHAAYHRDDNAVPPQYVLVPHGNTSPADDPEALRRALAGAARRAGYPDAVLAKYTLSATEQEIVKGAFQAEHAEEHVFCFLRELDDLPDHVPPAADDRAVPPAVLDYGDYHPEGTRDSQAQALLADLTSRLRAQLGPHAFRYHAEWNGAVVSTTHLDQLCQDMLSSLARVIDVEIERLEAYSHLAREQAAHHAFAEEHIDGFIGRTEYLATVARYVDRGDAHPLCLFARGGLGKSALLARAAHDAGVAHPEAVVVTRFLGVTSASADPRSLLEDLCGQIGAGYGCTEPVPQSLQELQQEFGKRLALATPDRPLLLFLDALDQLVGGAGGNLGWLPTELPAHVRIVTTTRPGAPLDALARRLPGDHLIEIVGMHPDEGEALLQSWLQRAQRTLTSAQRATIIDRFRLRGSPLYLRLAFEDARLWSAQRPDMRIGEDELSLIGQLYDRLEAEHGAELVGHALGFLACTFERLGLSEDELLDALTADEATWAEFTAGAAWQLPVRRLPVVVWSRLYFDLAAYLSPRASEGASLMSFFHKELADVAHDRYVAGRAAHLHGVLADVLQALARGKGADARAWNGSTHALAELPYHLTRAERWDDLFATLTDFTYLEEKARRVAVVTGVGAEGAQGAVHHGVRALIDDYDRALAAFPAE